MLIHLFWRQHALREFLQKEKVMVKERGQLPIISTFPLCAQPEDVREYETHNHPGPSPTNILYNWNDSLKTCLWNIDATILLASKYLEELDNGRIKYKGKIVRYDAEEVTMDKLTALIPKRLDRIQRHWKDSVKGGFAENHSLTS